MRIELVRRLFVWQSLLLWQGGFLFYALVVVPIGADVLGSDREQGFVTQRVTIWLNRIGWLSLVMLAWDAWVIPQLRRVRLAIVIVCSVLLLVLMLYLYDRLDGLLDSDEHRIRERRRFYFWHAVYLWVSATHWFAMLVMCWLTLRAWRERDVTLAMAPRSHIPDTSDSVSSR
jgi:hypothetical protein